MLFSPLDQFENTVLFPFFVFGFDLSLTLFSISLMFSAVFFFFAILFGLSNPLLIPNRFQFFLETLYEFVYFVQKSQTGQKGLGFFPFFFTIFIFIFCSNFFGLIPYSFTPTAQLFLPIFLSFTCNLSFLFISFYRHGASFFKFFIPTGVSIFLVPLITIIEISTYLLRTFSLALRLFANIMAGHTLLFICVGSLSASFSLGSAMLFITSLALILAIYCLEMLIAFLQAYVFLVLLSVYLADALNVPGHLCLAGFFIVFKFFEV